MLLKGDRCTIKPSKPYLTIPSARLPDSGRKMTKDGEDLLYHGCSTVNSRTTAVPNDDFRPKQIDTSVDTTHTPWCESNQSQVLRWSSPRLYTGTNHIKLSRCALLMQHRCAAEVSSVHWSWQPCTRDYAAKVGASREMTLFALLVNFWGDDTSMDDEIIIVMHRRDV